MYPVISYPLSNEKKKLSNQTILRRMRALPVKRILGKKSWFLFSVCGAVNMCEHAVLR